MVFRYVESVKVMAIPLMLKSISKGLNSPYDIRKNQESHVNI